MAVIAMKTEAKDGDSTDIGKDLAGMFKRMPSAALKKICSIAQDELDSRDGKDVGGMSDSEFAKYLDAQFSKADQAAREADLRNQLMGKKSKATKKEDDYE